MNNWDTLKKELQYHGIVLVGDKRCRVFFEEEKPVTQGIIRTIRQLKQSIQKRCALMQGLWNDISFILTKGNSEKEIINDEIKKLFVHSLKDLSSFLLCFEECDNSLYSSAINSALSKDISLFSKEQMNKIIDYKISVDWLYRVICRLRYIVNLLRFSLCGADNVNQNEKFAISVAGPWSNTDLPMKERVFPYGRETDDRRIQKQKQRRYWMGFENYNNDGRVGEGRYWRELRNEPFSWYDRKNEDPYPSRYSLSMWG